jgi:hypothetical protein
LKVYCGPTPLPTVIDDTETDIAELIRKDFGYTPERKDLNLALLDWVHYRARRIPCRPRQVIMSREVRSKLSMNQAISCISSALRAGEDVGAWLSRKIETHMRSPRADMMFNDWQITHFHLSRVFVKPNMVGGTPDLLYAHVTAEYATLLDALPHESWAAQKLLRILLETRPVAMERAEAKGILGTQRGSRTDDELLALRTSGLATSVLVSGRTFYLTGISQSRHATRLVDFCSHLRIAILNLKKQIENGTIERPFASRIAMQIGVSVRLGVSFDTGSAFTVYDKVRRLPFFQSRGLE